MASEKPYSVKPYEGPIHHTEGQWQNVIGPNGHRLNLRPMPPDEANHLARILNSASSAAADEVGRLRKALERIKAQCNQIREAPAFPMLTMNARMDSIKVIARAALATDASGAMKHKENGNG